MFDPPPILAACVTQPGREGLLSRAARNFLAQTYGENRHDPHRKRLNIYTTTTEHAAHLRGLIALQVDGLNVNVEGGVARVIVMDPWDALIHAAVAAKAWGGDDALYAIWDDDNQSHPLRLFRQASVVRSHLPCFLAAGIWYYHDSAEIFICDLERRFENLRERILPWTMVCRAADVLEAVKYDGTSHVVAPRKYGSPSTALAQLVQSKFNSIRPDGEWWWTVTGVRGDNANGYEWHRRWATHHQKGRTAEWLREREVLIKHWLDEYRWDGPPRLDVCGNDGVAYAYAPRTGWPDHFPPVGEPADVDRITEQATEENDADSNEEEAQTGPVTTARDAEAQAGTGGA